MTTEPAKDFYYSAHSQVIEEHEDGLSTAIYLWSPVYIDAMIIRYRDTDNDQAFDTSEFAVQDANFNTTLLIDGAGELVERFEYDPYGAVTALGATTWTAKIGGSDFDWVYLHQGGRLDTNTGLYDFRSRAYDPALGRFLQQDKAVYVDGANLYQYEVSDPTGRLDPMGTDTQLGGIGGISGGGYGRTLPGLPPGGGATIGRLSIGDMLRRLLGLPPNELPLPSRGSELGGRGGLTCPTTRPSTRPGDPAAAAVTRDPGPLKPDGQPKGPPTNLLPDGHKWKPTPPAGPDRRTKWIPSPSLPSSKGGQPELSWDPEPEPGHWDYKDGQGGPTRHFGEDGTELTPNQAHPRLWGFPQMPLSSCPIR
jgi:RHS repeat-associated protein